MQLKDLGEKALIDSLGKGFAETDTRVLKGIGDDCAATLITDGNILLSSTDTLTEEIHFSLTYSPPRLLGNKLVNISISDIAAMGGSPLFVLISLTMPGTIDDSFVKDLYSGVREACKDSGARLVGGNVSSASGENPIVLTSTVLGEVSREEVIYRDGAGVGETIYVTGTLGDSALGLIGLQGDGPSAITRSPYRNCVAMHLDPKPRTQLARTIARQGLATSMMDLSDGVASDLPQLVEASKVSALVETNLLPVSTEVKAYMDKEKDAMEMILGGGEDYELLFTAKQEVKKEIQLLAEQSKVRITAIGKTTPPIRDSRTSAVRFIQSDGAELKIKGKGFDHYK